MAALDEITKEKQRVSEALSRADAQREKLAGELAELEATERVLARYSKGSGVRRTALARTPTSPRNPASAARAGRGRAVRPPKLGASVARRASMIRCLPSQTARRSLRSPLRARALAPTTSALPLPGTCGPVGSKSGMEGSTPGSRPEQNETSRCNTGKAEFFRGLLTPWREFR
jgi:hypothetical protein